MRCGVCEGCGGIFRYVSECERGFTKQNEGEKENDMAKKKISGIAHSFQMLIISRRLREKVKKKEEILLFLAHT